MTICVRIDQELSALITVDPDRSWKLQFCSSSMTNKWLFLTYKPAFFKGINNLWLTIRNQWPEKQRVYNSAVIDTTFNSRSRSKTKQETRETSCNQLHRDQDREIRRRDNCNHSHRDQDQDQARELNKGLARQVAIIIIEGLILIYSIWLNLIGLIYFLESLNT